MRESQSKLRNSSTVISAWRMRARNVPMESSLCCGIERLTRSPGFDITRWLPTCPTAFHPAFSKALAASLPEILPSRATRLDGHEDFALIRPRVFRRGLLILSPQPRGNRFFDVGQRLLLVLPLRDASGQGGTLSDDPAVLSLGERYVEDHTHILPIASPSFNSRCSQRFSSPRHSALTPRHHFSASGTTSPSSAPHPTTAPTLLLAFVGRASEMTSVAAGSRLSPHPVHPRSLGVMISPSVCNPSVRFPKFPQLASGWHLDFSVYLRLDL